MGVVSQEQLSVAGHCRAIRRYRSSTAHIEQATHGDAFTFATSFSTQRKKEKSSSLYATAIQCTYRYAARIHLHFRCLGLHLYQSQRVDIRHCLERAEAGGAPHSRLQC